MLSILTVLLLGSPAQATDLQGSWDEPVRYYIENEVHIPYLMWWMADRYKQARVSAFHLRAIFDCLPAVKETKRSVEVECTVSEIGIIASGVKSEEGLLQPIIDEVDETLTGAMMQLRVREPNRIVNVDVQLDAHNQRESTMNENMRLTLSRLAAGLDYQLPKSGDGTTGWYVHNSLLTAAPDVIGSAGVASIIRKSRSTATDNMMAIDESGTAVIVPSNGYDTFETRLEGKAQFDVDAGQMTHRRWVLIGEPTPGSAAAEVGLGIPYMQKGRVTRLAADESVDVGESTEVAAPGMESTTLPAWDFGDGSGL